MGDTTVSPMKNWIYIIALLFSVCFGINPAFAQTPENQTTKTTTTKTTQTPRPPVERPAGYGTMLFKMMLALILTCVLAVVILKWGMRKLVTHSNKDDQMKVLARMAIEPRRSILVVKVGQRTLVLGSSESGMELLTELHGKDADVFLSTESPDKKPSPKPHQKRAFSLEESVKDADSDETKAEDDLT